MMKLRWYIPLSCFLALHTPDHQELLVEAKQIFVLRGLAKELEQHVAKGTKTIIYVDGQKIGIKETPEEIKSMIENCGR